jgi:hypothetical protein
MASFHSGVLVDLRRCAYLSFSLLLPYAAFLPLMTLNKTAMMAMTNRMWMNPPMV